MRGETNFSHGHKKNEVACIFLTTNGVKQKSKFQNFCH